MRRNRIHVVVRWPHVGRRAAVGRAKCTATSHGSGAVAGSASRADGGRSRLRERARIGSAKSHRRNAVAHYEGSRSAAARAVRREARPRALAGARWAAVGCQRYVIGPSTHPAGGAAGSHDMLIPPGRARRAGGVGYRCRGSPPLLLSARRADQGRSLSRSKPLLRILLDLAH